MLKHSQALLKPLKGHLKVLILMKHFSNQPINPGLSGIIFLLVAERNIAYFKGQKFKNDKDIERLIRLLKRNQKENGLWGWWKGSEESLWISLHVLEALTHEELLG